MLDKTRFRLKHDVLMAVSPSMAEALNWALVEKFEQFSVHTDEKGEVRIGVPLGKVKQDEYKWLYHKMKGLE
jgi:hypothetical protein